MHRWVVCTSVVVLYSGKLHVIPADLHKQRATTKATKLLHDTRNKVSEWHANIFTSSMWPF